MLNKKITIFGIIMLILCFFTSWFDDYIIGYFTCLTILFIKFILLIMLIIFLYDLIISINKNNYKSSVIPITCFIISLFVYFYNFRLIRVKIELELYEDKRDIIIEKVKNNEFIYYSGKNIKLPIYKYVSTDGEIYVYRNDDEQIISFWVFRGVLSGSIELIYSSNGENIIYEVIAKEEIIKIVELKENWYYVVTNY